MVILLINSKYSLVGVLLLIKRFEKWGKSGVKHEYHAKGCMPGNKPKYVYNYVFPFNLQDGGSGLGINDDAGLKLLSMLSDSLAGPTLAQLEILFSSDYL